MPVLFIVTKAACAKEPEVETVGKDHFRLTYETEGSASIPDAQDNVKQFSKSLCGDETITLGKYRFETKEMVGKPEKTALTLTQEVHCGDAAADRLKQEQEQGNGMCQLDTSRSKPYKPTEADEQALLKFIQAFDAVRRHGDHEVSYQLLDEILTNKVSQADWVMLEEQLNIKNAKQSRASMTSWFKEEGRLLAGVVLTTEQSDGKQIIERLLYRQNNDKFLICIHNADIISVAAQ